MIDARVRVLVDSYMEDDPPKGSVGIVDDEYDSSDHTGEHWTMVVAFPNGQMAVYSPHELEEVV